MSKIAQLAKKYIGLDVHKETIVIAVAAFGPYPAEMLMVIDNNTDRLIKELLKIGAKEDFLCCYEAGPTGYNLYRELNQAGIRCCVVAPALIPTQAGSRVKTDKRDAIKLAHFLRSGDLTAVYVPEPECEAIRDLTRAREDAKEAERDSRHQLAKFLLRHGRRYPGKTSWSKMHFEWISQQKFPHAAQNRVLEDYLRAVQQASERVEQLTQDIAQTVETWKMAPLVKALQALRGVQLITAATIVAELGDISRFHNPRQLMSYLGLVPSEYSSGQQTRRGSITKTGNGHVRRVLVEAAWSYRYAPRTSAILQKRQEGLPQEVKDIAWKAQKRLNRRYTVMTCRGKNKQQTVTAVARELSGFIWAIGQEIKLAA